MIKVENVKVFNIGGAIYSARNALNSWHLSDSNIETDQLGERDLALAQRLYHGGPSHRKFLRQIFVTADVTAPLYWWKEADTYKVATVANSCSTMHKIHAKEFTLSDFSTEHLSGESMKFITAKGETITVSPIDLLCFNIDMLNAQRSLYLATQDKEVWWQLIQLLPSSYNQKRTWSFNYETVMNMIDTREYHKLDEWVEFVKELKKLPYIREIRGEKYV